MTKKPEGSDLTPNHKPQTTRGEAAPPELLRRVEAWEQGEAVPAAARDLLARIHGDGGHHMDAVGYEQAFRDAGERVVKERTEADETAYRFSLQVTALTLEVERLRGIIATAIRMDEEALFALQGYKP